MPRLARAAAAALVSLAAAAAAGCGDRSEALPRLPATSAHEEGVALGPDGSLVTRGVGPTCLPCHADVADRYRSSGMSDAMTLPCGAGSIESSLVGKTCVDAATGITIRFEARDGRYVQRIVYVDAAGVERGSYEFPVDLIVGSGHMARTYLAVREGRIVELPATWYRETGALALSPGPYFRDASGSHVALRCIECHVGDATPHASDAPGRFTGAISLGITCRRCHGEAPRHVRTGKTADVVNPPDLDFDRQDEICSQCHLSAAVDVTKPGTSLARDYRPGMPLGALLGVYADAASKDDAPESGVAGHGTRLRLSRCATESGKGGRPALLCTTCHDPHEGHRLSAAERRLDRGCAVCHTEASCTLPAEQRAAKTCTSCHMAVYPSSDIAHTKTTDHFIRARPPAVTGPARPAATSIGALATEDRAVRSLLDPEGALPGAELLRALAYERGVDIAETILLRDAPGYARRLTESAERLVREAPEDPDAAFLLASARLHSGRCEEAVALFAEHERRFGRRAQVRSARAFAERTLHRSADVVALSARMALDDDPFAETAGRILAEALTELGRAPEAVTVLADLRVRLGPSIGRAEQMVDAARAARDVPRAVEAAYDRLMFRPRSANVLSDAAHVLALAAGDAAQARVLFRDALSRDADCVSALVGLARVEAAADDLAAARPLAERAERLQPGIPEVEEILRAGGGKR